MEYIYIYIYIYVCVCVCVYFYSHKKKAIEQLLWTIVRGQVHKGGIELQFTQVKIMKRQIALCKIRGLCQQNLTNVIKYRESVYRVCQVSKRRSKVFTIRGSLACRKHMDCKQSLISRRVQKVNARVGRS